MIDRIIAAFKTAGIKEYRITETKKETAELFFVKKRLDMRRSNNCHSFDVTVFNRFEKNGKAMRGFTDIRVFPGTSEEELVKKLKDAYRAAGFVCNPVFEFPAPVQQKVTKENPSLEEAVKVMSEALFASDTREDAFLNSAELFINKSEVRIVTSEGTDVSFPRFYVKGEFVAQCKEPQDVETYRDFAYKTLEKDELARLVADVLEMTKARAIAKEAPKAGKYRVIISGRYLKTIFEYYIGRSSSSYVYAKYSNYKVGDMVQGENISGEKLNITLKADDPFNSEGIPMKDRVLLKDGELQVIQGNARFAYYLGIEPTGAYDDIELAKGHTSLAEMKSQPYLHVVNFSDFQLDDFSGHFGGEIRLAFLFDGEKEIPVTGGSISGNFIELQDNICLSSELQKENGYTGPLAICFDSLNVAGKDE